MVLELTMQFHNIVETITK